MDALSIIVPNSHTNVLPHVKIHDVPNVTKEQWEWLKSLNNVDVADNNDELTSMSPSLRSFERRLKSAVNKLFSNLDIPDEVNICSILLFEMGVNLKENEFNYFNF